MKASNSPLGPHSYLKVVEWSDEDGCFVGSAPALVGQCCHGESEEDVLRQLQIIVAEVIALKRKYGDPIPPASAGKKYSGKFIVRVTPELHQQAALKAFARGESLNEFVVAALKKA